MYRALVGALLIALPAPITAEEPPASLLALQKAIRDVIKKTEPSIASIAVSRSNGYRELEPGRVAREPGQLGGFDPDGLRPEFLSKAQQKRIRQLDLSSPRNVPEGYGTGVVVDKSGLILTNAHVVEGATKIFVRLPGKIGCYANIHALDPRSDLAILRLIQPPRHLPEIPFGKGEEAQKGDFVVALSNPYSAGFTDGSPSASQGIVSNLRRRLPGYTYEAERNKLSLHHFGTLIQTDVRLQSGCSGGALLNLKGEMIGLLSSQAALTGLDTPGGFALPMSSGLQRIISALKRGEEVEYGFIGVQFAQRSRGRPYLLSVIPGSPAERGNLKNGDYIHSIDGKEVTSNDDLFLALGLHLAGERVRIVRSQPLNGRKETVQVTLGKFYLPRAMIASKRPQPRAGLRVDYPTTLVQGYWPNGRVIPRGVRIREVIKDSPADRANLREDLVVLEVNGRKVVTPSQFYREMDLARGGVTLTILRNRNEETVRLPAK